MSRLDFKHRLKVKRSHATASPIGPFDDEISRYAEEADRGPEPREQYVEFEPRAEDSTHFQRIRQHDGAVTIERDDGTKEMSLLEPINPMRERRAARRRQ